MRHGIWRASRAAMPSGGTVGAESDQRIVGSRLLQGVVEGEETTHIFRVGDECCPYLLGRFSWTRRAHRVKLSRKATQRTIMMVRSSTLIL